MGANAKKAKTWIKNWSFARSDDGGQPVIKWVTAGEAIAKGAPVVMVGNYAMLAVAATATVLFGISAKAAAATGSTIPVIAASRNTIFVGQLDTAEAGTFLYRPRYALFSGTTAPKVVAGTTAGTYALLQVLSTVSGDSAADTTNCARVYFKINQSQYEGVPGAASL